MNQDENILRIYERAHPNNLKINSFHKTSLIFKVTLKKQTVQEKRNQDVNRSLQ